MPYTPPSQRSPANSTSNSPVIGRDHPHKHTGAPSVQHQRAGGLPRCHSATYLHRHRRTPSISDHQPAYDGPPSIRHMHHRHGAEEKDHAAANGVTHPPRPELLIATDGSTASPSESSVGSEDDDDRGRGRQIRDLAATLRESIVVPKRPHSPTRTEEDSTPVASKSAPAANMAASTSPGLSPEARKITHSRSSSEIHISSRMVNVSASPTQGSPDGSEDEDGLHIKPPLLRKKSGELVKPALRASSQRRPLSVPGTPTYAKNVHFNEDIEQVRHFLQVDRPIAVSAGSSPVETYDSETEYPFGHEDGYKSRTVEWEIRTANFPKDTVERLSQPVRVEKIFLSSDFKTLVGTVAVANIAYQKLVVARFTFDYWKTTSEVVAEYNNDVRRKQVHDGFDRFNFNIKLSDQAHLESKTLLLCVRYSVNGQDYWDNNSSINYQVDFIKKTVPRKAKVGMAQGSGGAGSLGAIPRSRHSSTMPRPRSFPASADDDFARNFEFGTGDSLLLDRPNPNLRLKHGRKGSVIPSQARQNKRGQHFATRYDFSASLSTALTTAQQALGDHNGPQVKDLKSSQASKQAAPAVQPVDGPRPDKISSERPDLHSAEYNDLIQKFCYVGRTIPPGLA